MCTTICRNYLAAGFILSLALTCSADTLTTDFTVATQVKNSGTSPAVVNELACWDGSTAVPGLARKCVVSPVSATIIGVAVSAPASPNYASIVQMGYAQCTFDSSPAPTVGHYVVASGTNAGNCVDAGASGYPSTQPVGILTSAPSSGPLVIFVFSITSSPGGLTIATAPTTSTASGAIQIASGSTATSGNSGKVSIDAGAPAAGATAGVVQLGGTNASAVSLGNGTATTTSNGPFTSLGAILADNGLSLAAGTSLVLQPGLFVDGSHSDATLFTTLGSANALNYLQISNAPSGSGPQISAVGADPNINLLVSAKGSNSVNLRSNGAVALAATNSSSSAVNYASVVGAVTGSGVTFGVGGGDPSINLVLNPKGPMGSVVIPSGVRTGVSSNTDLAGQLTLSSGSATYPFTGTYTSTPICVATDASGLQPVYVNVSTTNLVVNGTGTHAVNYVCVGRN